jgi:ABC-2 type transport system permease protein
MHNKRNDLFRLIITLAIVILSALVLSVKFFKLDLTEEKRHSLTEATRSMLDSLDDQIFIRCYLHGDFPAEFKKMEQSIRERLEEFRDYSNGRLEYEFIDPYESGDDKKTKEVFRALDEKGLRFSNINFTENGTKATKMIWPGVIVQYRNKEYPIQLLKSEIPMANDAMINNSVNNLEYELAQGLRKITRPKKPSIAVLYGHREMDALHMADFLYGLQESYSIEFVKIDSQLNAFSDKVDGYVKRINKYDALIVAGPDSTISDRDLLVMDQFVMNGGKVLWMVDALRMNLDSLQDDGYAMAVSNEMNLYPMLFNYGARLNRSIVIDFQGAPIVLDNGPMGTGRNMVDATFFYAPLMMSPNNAHPICSNLDPIKLEFAGSIDSVNPNPEVRKIKLLQSSELSKDLKAPVRVDLDLMSKGQEYFANNNQPNRMMAMILEGRFPSAFANNLTPQLRNDPAFGFLEKSQPTSMIVIADADICYNEVDTRGDQPKPIALGYDPLFKRVIYDNKEFLLNCMNYLLDDQALITVRSRAITLRKLNMGLVDKNKNSIKIQNTVLPIAIVLILGFGHFFIRKRRWTKAA